MAANLLSSDSQRAEFSTFVDLLHYWAIHQPEQLAYRFLIDGEQQEASLSYRDLDRQARAIAAQLQRLELQGGRALLIYSPGLDFIAAFFGCLYAGVIAVPVYPPRRNLSSIQTIAADAQASTVLTQQSLLTQTAQLVGIDHWIATDQILSKSSGPPLTDGQLTSGQPDAWQPITLDPNTLAFLQYTSGSTGQPKGVMVSHANLLHNSALIYEKFGHSPASRGVIWLPPYHDMGLIGGILQPLYGGFPVTLMAPVAFLQKPIRWLEAISRCGANGAVTSGGPNFAYERCVEKITPAQKANLDLSGWTVAFTGAEPIRAATLSRFTAAFADCGFRPEAFYPCYGLAEATLLVTGGDKTSRPQQISVSTRALQQHRVEVVSDADAAQPEAAQRLVSCGQPAADQSLLIVDPETRQPCAPDRIGEIWLAGKSVTRGYWQQPELNARTFVELQSAAGSEHNQSFYLRTGDLGFIYNNELFITGRLKDVLIIRGRNYYPQDIERTVEQSHPALSPGCGAAFICEVDGTEQLIIIQEVNREHWRSANPEEMITAIRAAISEEHQLQAHTIQLLKPGTIPKTSSGKIKRYVCREKFENGEFTVIKTVIEQDLTSPSRQTEPTRSQSKKPIASPWNGHLACLISAGPQTDLNRLNPSMNPSMNPLNRLNASTNKLVELPIAPASNPNQTSRKTEHLTDCLIDWLRDYATHHINSRLIDERRCIPPAIVLDFGNQGLLGMQVSQQYGGLELGHTETMRVLQQLGAIDPTLALFVGLNNVLGIRPIAQSAAPVLKDDLLPLLATGRELAAFALTEPGAGANPQAIAAHAIPEKDGWRLNGTKIWSGSAAWAGVINVFVQHQQDQHRGISGFVLQRGNPGLRQGPEALTMGMRGMVQNTLYLENAPVTTDQLLGTVGTGMSIAQDAMMYGRLAIAAASVGGMKRCAQLMLRYSARRSIATGKLLEHPVVLTRLHHLNAAIVATETLVMQITQRLDAGESVPIEAYTVCKTAAPEFYWQAADGLVQTLGGRGYIETNLAPQILRDARVLRVFEGPTETLNAFLGSRILHHQSWQQWLSHSLNAPEISQRLLDAAAQISDCCHHAGFDQPLMAQLASGLIGEVATLAILWASLENANHCSSDRRLKLTLEWIQTQFEHRFAQALITVSEHFNNCRTDVVTNQILEYEQTIGDIEQTLAGEDQALDALLRKVPVPTELSSPESASVSVARQNQPQTGTNPIDANPENANLADTAQAIQTWMIQWLSQKLNIAAEHIDRHRPFADYGIDSVIAVELAQDLETWLNLSQPLEATLAWNFPSITTLSYHLATLTPTPLQSPTHLSNCYPTATQKQAASHPPDSLTEPELAALLAAELAAAKGRKRR